MDKINFTFQELAEKELPRLLAALNASPAYALSELLGEGTGVASVLKTIGKPKDFEGLYVFIDAFKMINISRMNGKHIDIIIKIISQPFKQRDELLQMFMFFLMLIFTQ